MAQSNNNQMKREKTTPRKIKAMWIVVLVESGIPVLAEAYHDLNIAEERERFFRRSLREGYDEVAVFEVEPGSKAYA